MCRLIVFIPVIIIIWMLLSLRMLSCNYRLLHAIIVLWMILLLNWFLLLIDRLIFILVWILSWRCRRLNRLILIRFHSCYCSWWSDFLLDRFPLLKICCSRLIHLLHFIILRFVSSLLLLLIIKHFSLIWFNLLVLLDLDGLFGYTYGFFTLNFLFFFFFNNISLLLNYDFLL